MTGTRRKPLQNRIIREDGLPPGNGWLTLLTGIAIVASWILAAIFGYYFQGGIK